MALHRHRRRALRRPQLRPQWTTIGLSGAAGLGWAGLFAAAWPQSLIVPTAAACVAGSVIAAVRHTGREVRRDIGSDILRAADRYWDGYSDATQDFAGDAHVVPLFSHSKARRQRRSTNDASPTQRPARDQQESGWQVPLRRDRRNEAQRHA